MNLKLRGEVWTGGQESPKVTEAMKVEKKVQDRTLKNTYTEQMDRERGPGKETEKVQPRK